MLAQKNPRDYFVNEKGLKLGISPYGFFFLALSNELRLSMANQFTSFCLSFHMEMIILVFSAEMLYASKRQSVQNAFVYLTGKCRKASFQIITWNLTVTSQQTLL